MLQKTPLMTEVTKTCNNRWNQVTWSNVTKQIACTSATTNIGQALNSLTWKLINLCMGTTWLHISYSLREEMKWCHKQQIMNTHNARYLHRNSFKIITSHFKPMICWAPWAFNLWWLLTISLAWEPSSDRPCVLHGHVQLTSNQEASLMTTCHSKSKSKCNLFLFGQVVVKWLLQNLHMSW